MLKFCLFLLVVVSLASCTGFSKTQREAYKRIEILPDGKITVVLDTKTDAKIKNPSNSSQPGLITINDSGVSTQISGNWEKDVEDYIAQNGIVFYIGSVIAILAGLVVMIWLRQFILGGSIILAGIGLAFMPHIIHITGPYAIAGFVLLIIVGIVWVVAKIWSNGQTKKRNVKAVAKLKKEGKNDEATAVMRAIDEDLDKKFAEIK